MVQVGTIEYEARVTGVAEAKANAQDFADTQEDVAESSRNAATAGGFLAGVLGLLSNRQEEAGEEADRSSTKTKILSSSLFFLGSTAVGTAAKLTGLTGALSLAKGAAGALSARLAGLTLSGVVGSVTGAISGFVGWLAAGSAGALAFGAALGAAIGVAGVWVLKVTGALDAVRGFGQYVGGQLPASVRDGLLAVTGIFAGGLAVIGNFITGTLDGGFEEGFARARKTAQIFLGAFDRTMGRIKSFTDDATGYVQRKFTQLGDAVVGTVKRAWNTNIPARISFPSATIAGRTVGGGGIDIPRLQVGGMVDETGIAVVHKGESVIPEPLTSAARRGGGTGGGGTVIESLTVTIDAGDFDPSNMSRRDLERLAERVASAIGKKTNTRAGVR